MWLNYKLIIQIVTMRIKKAGEFVQNAIAIAPRKTADGRD